MKTKLPHPNQIKALFGLMGYDLRAAVRNKTGIFFSLFFPLIFVLIFGSLGNSTTKTHFGIPDSLDHSNAVYQTLNQLANQDNSPIDLQTGSQAELETKLSQGKVDAVVEPSDSPTTITLATSNSNPGGKAVAEGLISGVISNMNLSAAQSSSPTFHPPFGSTSRDISGKTFRYIDFALPGQIGFSLLSLATFGVAFPFLTLRRTLVLKRMFATTVTPLTFVLAICGSRAVQALIQTLIILGVGVFAFHFSLPHGFLTLVEVMILAALAVISFLGFGILVANIAKDEQSAPVALNLFNLPQMLLGGVFFQIDGMPAWVQHIGNNLPLSYFNIALRKVTVDGLNLFDIWPYLLGMLVWSIIAYFFAIRTFKAE